MLLTLLFFLVLLAPVTVVLSVFCLSVIAVVLFRYRSLLVSDRVTALGVTADGWWVNQGQGRRPVRWLSGSHRRYHHLRLVWGFWPWQELNIYPDSVCTEDDFRRLKAALYGSV